MRHHFAVIKGLYRQGEPDKAAEYIDTLGEELSACEQKRYCKNPVVNAVLSVLSEKVQAAGIDVSMRLDIPEELPFDNADICTVLANATENAVNACARAPEGRRHIEITADLIGRTRLVLSVENGVRAPVPLDGDGLPAAQKNEEHGYGLLNVRRIVEKYDGLWQCESGEETFGMKIVLFAPTEPPAGRKRMFRPRTLAAIPAFLLAAVLFLNCLPSTVEALSEIPVIGRAVRVLDFRTWGIGWGDSGIRTEYPETDSPDVNARVAEYIAAYKSTAETYFQTRYDGYVGADFTGTILPYDEKLLTIELACTINAGSSLSYYRYVTADNETGDIVELADLFRDDADWDAVLSEEILRQIHDRVETAYDNYYGFGIFESDRGFSSLLDPEIYCDGTARPNFYIDTDGSLVIVFDEGEIAPGNTGIPVFVIPAEVTEAIAAEDSLLFGGGYA